MSSGVKYKDSVQFSHSVVSTRGVQLGGGVGKMAFLRTSGPKMGSLPALSHDWGPSLEAWPSNCSFLSADASGSSGLRVLPQGYGWSLLYGSLLLGLVGGVCTLGAGLYARASFLTFLLVSGSLASVLVSFVAVGPRDIPLAPRPGPNGSSLPPQVGHFTGFNSSTLKANLDGELGAGVLGVLRARGEPVVGVAWNLWMRTDVRDHQW